MTKLLDMVPEDLKEIFEKNIKDRSTDGNNLASMFRVYQPRDQNGNPLDDAALLELVETARNSYIRPSRSVDNSGLTDPTDLEQDAGKQAACGGKVLGWLLSPFQTNGPLMQTTNNDVA